MHSLPPALVTPPSGAVVTLAAAKCNCAQGTLICQDCGQESQRTSNRQVLCVACRKARHAARERSRRAQTPDVIASSNRAYRAANIDRLRKLDRLRYKKRAAEDRDRLLEEQRLRYLDRQRREGLDVDVRGPGGFKPLKKPKVEVNRDHYWRHRDQHLANAKARYKSRALHNRISAAVRRGLRGGKAGQSVFDLLAFSVEELKTHIERQFLPGMSWSNMHDWHIDHILPVSSLSFTSVSEPNFQLCWSLTNLRPLWATDNLKKHSKRLFLI